MPPGGVPWSQRGTKGGGQTVATQSRPEVQKVDVGQTGNVSAGTTERTEIYAPSDSLYRVFAMQIGVPADADWTDGSHSFKLYTAGNVRVLWGRSDYTKRVEWGISHWKDANSLAWPPDSAAANSAVSNLEADETRPISIEYDNNGDAPQENKRGMKLSVEEVSY